MHKKVSMLSRVTWLTTTFRYVHLPPMRIASYKHKNQNNKI